MMSKAQLQKMADRGDRFAKQWLAEGRYAEAADETEQQRSPEMIEQRDPAEAAASAPAGAPIDQPAAAPMVLDPDAIYAQRRAAAKSSEPEATATRPGAQLPDPDEVYARRRAATMVNQVE